MTRATAIELTGKIVEMLTPLESEERLRIVSAALALLGETARPGPRATIGGRIRGEDIGAPSPRAQIWMEQHEISSDLLAQVFHMRDGNVEIIASSPGKDTKERALNAYLLTGIANLLTSDEPSFDDKIARAVCKSSGCYDGNNHATYLKERGNEFTGTKEKGWILTAPGLKRAAEVIKNLGRHHVS